MIGRAVALSCCLLWQSPAALADPVWDMLVEFGLPGIWAKDCHRAATRTNPYSIWQRSPRGTATRRVMTGSATGSRLLGAIEAAQMIGEDRIELRLRVGRSTTDLVLARAENRVRTLWSRGADGVEYIRDGKLVATGADEPWLERCRF
jgi:hypothetical protein